MTMKVPGAKRPVPNTLLTDATPVHADWYKPIPSLHPKPTWARWLNVPTVELWQAVSLSCGIEPEYYLGDADEDFSLRMAVAVENFDTSSNPRRHCCRVRLQDVAILAERCGWTLPPEFPRHVEQAPESALAATDEQPAAAPEPEVSYSGGGQGVSTDGLVAWQAAALESWPRIVAEHGEKPSARRVMAWLKRHGPRDVFPKDQPDRDALHWIDRDKNPQTVRIKSISSRISEWRKAGKIPS